MDGSAASRALVRCCRVPSLHCGTVESSFFTLHSEHRRLISSCMAPHTSGDDVLSSEEKIRALPLPFESATNQWAIILPGMR